ncbi:PKD domain-containing protein [Georgenia ruanii]|uniref:PKD domain-containing protein n=1 Tax=Georgenia ruanii TaxID=348442 RepID=UPI0012642426|nr:PKD domain-containing protein [Georgenia ruanii]
MFPSRTPSHRSARPQLTPLLAAIAALAAVLAATAVPSAPARAAATEQATEAPGPAEASAASLIPAAGRLFGAYVAPSGSPAMPNAGDSQDAAAAFENAIGRKIDLHRLFLRWDDDLAQATVRADVARGRTPILSVRPERRDGTKISWAQVASGTVDADIAAQARAVASLGAPVFLTFHHEPDIETAFGTPAEYVAAWRHYVAVFRVEGVTNAAFTWIMTPSSFGSAYVGAGAAAYYPGDDAVDWLGLDAYNWYGCSPGKPAAWRPLATVVSPFRTFGKAHGKPLMLAEYGSAEDPAEPQRKAQWLREAAAALDGMPEIKAVSYFHTHGNCPWWLDSSPASLQAFTDVAALPAAHGRTTASLLTDVVHGPGPLTVTFDGAASAAAGHASGAGIAEWRLDFGDGTPAATGTSTPPAVLRHTYDSGQHDARLTVTASDGSTATDTRTIAAAPAPTLSADGTTDGDTGVTLKAWVNTRGLPGSLTFSWGTASADEHSTTIDVPAKDWTQEVRAPLTGLSPATRYSFRVTATTAAGTTEVTNRYVDTTGAPAVLLDAPTAVTATSATLNARVHPQSLDTTLGLELVPTGGGKPVRLAPVAVPAHTGYRWLSVPATGLSPGTTYDVRARATNDAGAGTATRPLTTAAGAKPTLSADGTADGDTGATLKAWVNTQGLPGTVTFSWGVSAPDEQQRTLEVPAKDGTQEVRATLTGLAPGTRYSFQVTATTAAGTGEVANRYVDTTGAPTVLLDAPGSVTPTAATVNARVHPHSRDTTLAVELVPAGGGAPVRLAPVPVAAHTGYRWLSVPATGLTPGTSYEIRATATNASGATTATRQLTTAG